MCKRRLAVDSDGPAAEGYSRAGPKSNCGTVSFNFVAIFHNTFNVGLASPRSTLPSAFTCTLAAAAKAS